MFMRFDVCIDDELENQRSKIADLEYELEDTKIQLDEARNYITLLEAGVKNLTGSQSGTTIYDSIMRHMNIKTLSELMACRDYVNNEGSNAMRRAEKLSKKRMQWLRQDYKAELERHKEELSHHEAD